MTLSDFLPFPKATNWDCQFQEFLHPLSLWYDRLHAAPADAGSEDGNVWRTKNGGAPAAGTND